MSELLQEDIKRLAKKRGKQSGKLKRGGRKRRKEKEGGEEEARRKRVKVKVEVEVEVEVEEGAEGGRRRTEQEGAGGRRRRAGGRRYRRWRRPMPLTSVDAAPHHCAITSLVKYCYKT